MQGIELKEFQINCVNRLLDATTVGTKKEVLVQAPTGSGKTIILLDYIEEYLEDNKNTIFVWLTPGKGELEEQSRMKMIKYLPTLNSKYILQDVQGSTWIIETKGGENADGISKNIDIKVENKFAVLKEYANKHNLKWGFVRDYDKNNFLYICNTKYTEDMNTDNWVKIDTVL